MPVIEERTQEAKWEYEEMVQIISNQSKVEKTMRYFIRIKLAKD